MHQTIYFEPLNHVEPFYVQKLVATESFCFYGKNFCLPNDIC